MIVSRLIKNLNQKKNFFKPHSNKIVPNLCFSGIQVINKKILSFVKMNKFQDFSKDILKKNENKIKIFCL